MDKKYAVYVNMQCSAEVAFFLHLALVFENVLLIWTWMGHCPKKWLDHTQPFH